MYKKVVTPANTTEEYYLTDAFGKTLAIENMKALANKWEYFVVTNERDARLKPSDNSVQFNYGEATFFLYDHLGNTRVSYSKLNDGIVVHSLTDYFPYGKILREYVSTRPRYLTTQHERDVETDLDYRGARYYDSEYGRFLSVDPWADKYPSWSTYNYVMGNPIMLIDPTGKGVESTSGDDKKKKSQGKKDKKDEKEDKKDEKEEKPKRVQPKYIPAPPELEAFPGAVKLPRGKGERVGWRLPGGSLGEWDSQHGEVEVYDKTGKKHRGAWDPETGIQTGDPVPGRTASRSKFDELNPAQKESLDNGASIAMITLKWTFAILAAPETFGLSLVVAAATSL